jgi:non-ribosomal peptide synthetase component F
MAQPLSILNDPPKILQGAGLLHKLIPFEKYGDSHAVDFTSGTNRQQYTYGEVLSCVQDLQTRILETLSQITVPQRFTRQHVVPVLLPQSPALYISQIAILESGGAFCPINLDAPQERIKFVVGDVEANVIITTSEFKNLVSWENGPKVIVVEEFPIVLKEKILSRIASREATSLDLAYVMYTSGSSGVPKGVAVSHLAVTQSLLAHERYIPAFKRFLQFAAPSFDVSVFEIFFPLTRGCALVGCNRSQLLNDLPGMINELEVDAAELTPTVVGSRLQKRSNVPGLQLLLTIGEMLTSPIVNEFGGSETKTSLLYGMYGMQFLRYLVLFSMPQSLWYSPKLQVQRLIRFPGPTEAAIHCTIHPLMKSSAKPGNIGVPLDTVSTYIAAASSTTTEEEIVFLPIGELGELVLGGPQLAQGYLNRPDQNKAAFIRSDGRDYYRTGDKGRQLEDGTIEIMGRMSAGQVKLRGQRVELGEIEEAVYKHPGIKTVCAVVLGSVLVVFALTDQAEMRPEAIFTTCAKWLPTFMVPSEVVLLQNFPYLPSGKVDKRKLESDYQKQREGDNIEVTNSRNPIEKIVKEVVEGLLGPFPKNMRLSAVGLDSLVAIRVASKLRSQGFSITTIAVLQAETVAALAILCETSKLASTTPKQVAVDYENQDAIADFQLDSEEVELIDPCTPLQSAMLSETAINAMAYRNWVEIELQGQSDMESVITALHSLASHNPILRTGFLESNNSEAYSQVVWKTLLSSQLETVQQLTYEYDTSKAASLLRPLQIQICHAGPHTKILVHLHHALYDAWSMELLLDDLDSILTGKHLAQRPPFELLVNGYLDGTLVTESWESREYWKDHLAYLDLRQVPNFHGRKTSSRGLAVTCLETSILTSGVEQAARRLSSSPQALFQAAYGLILSSYLGSSDICFGTVFSGRTLPIPGIEDIVGPCLSTLPVRVDVSTSTTLQSLVQDLNSTNRKHLEHSAVPLREIKSASGLNPRQSLFDTLIIWQQTLHSYDHARECVRIIDSVDNLEFNLTLEIIPSNNNIELKANYQTGLFPKSQVDMLLRQIEEVVHLIVQKEKTNLRDVFSHLNNDILSIENETPEISIGPETLVSPVERIALKDPDRPAIDFAVSIDGPNVDLQRMSYGELNLHANKIAHNLLRHHVLPNELVCICMEKSADLYTSILATTKIGAGYLPIMPDIPSERLRHILQEAKVNVIIAHSISRQLFRGVYGIRIIYLDQVDLEVMPDYNPSIVFCPSNISYCVFTSGSTVRLFYSFH